MEKWIICAESGVVLDNAAELLKSALSTLTDGRIEYGADDGKSNIVAVGTNGFVSRFADKGVVSVPKEKEGYGVFVGETDGRKAIIVGGADENGVLYGVMEILNQYLTVKAFESADMWRGGIFDKPLDGKLAAYKNSFVPAIPTRALWTWGHVIYDYRSYFDAMARLRLNEVVIWNDFVPSNAAAVVEYAHGLGIKVVWGYAWGWSQSCAEFFRTLTDEKLHALTESIIAEYEKSYLNTNADGIYFQSFTEFNTEVVNGKSVARVVVDFVNDTARRLLERYPQLHLQFGLHATSVKTKCEVIAGVDERVTIVWEDCGAFPYNYYPNAVNGFDETLAFTERLLSLRGSNERFGTVLKGMLKLDWTAFAHAKSSIAIGERPKEDADKRKKTTDKIWRVIRSGWLSSLACAKRTVELIAEKGNAPVVEALVEDGLLEAGIKLPVAIYAELLWSPFAPESEILARASAYSE